MGGTGGSSSEMDVQRASGILSHLGWSEERPRVSQPVTFPPFHTASPTERQQDLPSRNLACWKGSDVLDPETEPYVTWRIYFQPHYSMIALIVQFTGIERLCATLQL